MNVLSYFQKNDSKVIMLGSHPGIIQSMLDYDFMVGKQQPSIIAIIASNRKHERYFWGETEVVIPVVSKLALLADELVNSCNAIVNVQSARRVKVTTIEALDTFPQLKAIVIFAEQTPEQHTLEISEHARKKGVMAIGPASVGLLVPGHSKLGAIGGTQHQQLAAARILDEGDTAVVSTSGGVVNELIHTTTGAGLSVSFAVALGGDRFPLFSPADAMLLAQDNDATKRIVYFGELGGHDEYEIAKLIKEGRITKPIIAYIAGSVAELFETPPQFGHAKALAQSQDESAAAKKSALKKAGVTVCDNFAGVSKELARFGKEVSEHAKSPIGSRQKSLIISHVSGDDNGETQLLGKDLLTTVNENSTASLVLTMLLGHAVESKKAVELVDYLLRLLSDHGPYVSGAVNTIVTARAGKDLVSSLAAGLLTIGPRFGGAINAAADGWLNGAAQQQTPRSFVESFTARGGVIPGIGHKKYRADTPDPRIEALKKFTGNSNGDRYLKFARSVEEITLSKKNNLILNVDGAIAAILLDILESECGYDHRKLQELVDIEFFNAIFVLSRSVGFVGHYLDQKRHDEGLFRMPEDAIRYLGN